MIRHWRLRKKVLGLGGGLLLLNAAVGMLLARQVAQGVRASFPAGTAAARIRWGFPLSVVIEGLSVPDWAGKNPFFLRADRVVLQIPWWGLLARPLPARVIVTRPYLKVGSENVDLLVSGMKPDPNNWLLPKEGAAFANAPFIPYGLTINDGRVEVIEEEILKGRPVFIIAHLNLSSELTAVFAEPTIRLIYRGDFVTEDGKKIGTQEAEIRYQPRKRSMEGSIRLRHEHLGDFRNIYRDAPRPILIEGGIADFSMRFALTNGRHLRLTAHTLVQNLDLNGRVGEVSWADIMHAVEDKNRVYEWTVPVEGDLGDPAFNPHDYVLDEVEYKMKEKAAGRGLKIPGQMFFYADTPESAKGSDPVTDKRTPWEGVRPQQVLGRRQPEN